MAFVLKDRVRETSTDTGTNDFNLSATADYDEFSDAMSHGDTTWYCAVYGAEWEVGIGTKETIVSPASDKLLRTTIIASSNGGAKVNFSAGTKDIFMTLPAAKMDAKISAVRRQVFTASGTYTPDPYMKYCIIECIGGGGGGGGVASSATFALGGGGGGAGGYGRKLATAADIGASQTVTVGAAGAAGAGNGNGGAGGSSSVGILCSGGGGGGGNVGAAAAAGVGGAGGSAGAGDFGVQGAPGHPGLTLTASGANGFGAAGGSSPFGGGAQARATQGAGNAATGYGGGGGGGYDNASSSAFGGGAGFAGLVIITEYCTQ